MTKYTQANPSYPPDRSAPITAIVIYRNESAMLDRCLGSLRWCEQLITIDMCSTDNSRDIARRYSDAMFEVQPYPIAEPARVAAVRQARHDWVMMIDPDMYIPPTLAQQITCEIAPNPSHGAYALPQWFYFKDRQLTSTVWGALNFKQILIHRDRCAVLPYCNRLTELKPGQTAGRIEHDGHNHMHHYWSSSYRTLLWRHLQRYAYLEAKAIAAHGGRFNLRRAITRPIVDAYRSLRDFDGWRDPMRGYLLTGIYFAYTLGYEWLLLRAQMQPPDRATEQTHDIPTLTKIAVDVDPATGPDRDRANDADQPDAQPTTPNRCAA